MYDYVELFFPNQKIIIEVGGYYLGYKVTNINIDSEKPDYIIITTGSFHHRAKPVASLLIQKNPHNMEW